MDTGNKTLAQLSEEGKEARYVTVEVASKLSGYTKEYLERLCALHKVNFLFWNGDQYALELDSLLKETHTILLSYEGLTFLEKSGLTAPPQEALTSPVKTEEVSSRDETVHPFVSPIPHFAENGRLSSREPHASMFSFTGRAVVSDLRHPDDTREEETHVPISVPHEVKKGNVSSTPSPANVSVVQEKKSVVAAKSTATPLPLTENPISPVVVKNEGKSIVVLPVTRESRMSDASPVHDDWEERLFGGNSVQQINEIMPHTLPVSPSSTPVPSMSQYHPIHTSVDATLHHEDLPLFPKLINKYLPPAIVSLQKVEAVKEMRTPVVPEKKVTVNPSPLLVPGKYVSSSIGTIVPQVPSVMQNNLPTRPPEHHLSVIESHPLMKSVGFNMAFALLFLVPTFVVFNGVLTKEQSVSSVVEANNLAAVGASDEMVVMPQEHTAQPPKEEHIEFSDEVVVTPGEAPNSVLVQPIYRNGAGEVYEYQNARLEYGTTSVQ